MKIGIMSMQRIPNYGSLLQAYSLKRIIESLGHNVVFVDFRIEPDVYQRRNPFIFIKCRIKNIKKRYFNKNKVMAFIMSKVQKEYQHKNIFSSFYRQLGIDANYHYRTKVDMLIIGSDEVFNCLQHGESVGYALELFGKKNRAKRVITYAASFGSTTIEGLEKHKVKKQIQKMLERMDDYSVRDENSYAIVKELTNRDVKRHLDPVLIGGIEFEKWKPCNRTGFLVLYGYYLRFSKEECEKIIEFAHRRDLIVIALGEEQLLFDEHIPCNPDELLGYFENADCVVTDTFHGSIFSIIMHKNFVTLPRKGENGAGGNEQKIGSLLKKLGLEDRTCYNINTLSEIMEKPINYNEVDRIRTEEKELSVSYLRTNCQICEDKL